MRRPGRIGGPVCGGEGTLRIRIENREEASAFLAWVGKRHEVVVTRVFPRLAEATGGVPPGEFEVAVVASLNEGALRMEVDLLLRAWEAARRAEGKEVTLELVG